MQLSENSCQMFSLICHDGEFELFHVQQATCCKIPSGSDGISSAPEVSVHKFVEAELLTTGSCQLGNSWEMMC